MAHSNKYNTFAPHGVNLKSPQKTDQTDKKIGCTNMSKSLSILLCLCFCLGLHAQSHIANIRRFGMADGLAGRGANYVYEDSRGLVWFGTQNGVTRYDGRSFEPFNIEHSGLKQNQIAKIVEDQDGWLWLMPGWKDGQYHFTDWSLVNVFHNKVVSLKEHVGEKSALKPEQMHQVIAGPDRTLFFVSAQNEIFTYRPKEGFVKILPHNPVIKGVDILGADAFSRLYFIENFGALGQKVVLLSSKGERLREWAFSDKARIKWVGTQKQTTWLALMEQNGKAEICSLFPDGGRTVVFTWHSPDFVLGDDTPKFMYQDVSRELWVLWGKRLQVYNLIEGRLLSDLNEEYKTIREISDLVGIFPKKNGDVWATTSIEGVVRISLKTNPFHNYFTLNEQKSDNKIIFSCRGIWSGMNKVFVSTYQGVFVEDKSDGTLREINEPLYNYSILCHGDKQNRIWLADRIGFVELNPVTLQTKRHAVKLSEMGFSEINCIQQDAGNALWFGSHTGLGWFDPETNQVKRFEQINGHDTLHHSIIYAITHDQTGGRWLCTNTGLYLLRDGVGVAAHYGASEQGGKNLPSDLISHICFDAEGHVWLSTLDKGLLHYSLEKEQLIGHYDIAKGLTSNVLHAVYADEYGCLWISSERGIIRFDKKTKSARAYLPPDGTAEYEFNRHSHFRADNGTIYFGSINGVTSFNPNSFARDQDDSVPEMPILVTRFTVFNASNAKWEDRTEEFVTSGRIFLEDRKRYFSLQLSLPEHPDNASVAYEYRIDGLDNAWTALSDNIIRLYRLAYGRYKLQVRCRLPNGQFTSSTLEIPLINRPPLYMQGWFIALFLAVVLACVWYFLRRRAQNLYQSERLLQQMVQERTQTIAAQTNQIRLDKEVIEKQAQELKELNEVKSKFFANVSHELRTPLSLISGPISKILKKNTLDKEDLALLHLAQKSSAELQELVDDILDLIKLDSGTLGLQMERVEVKMLLDNLATRYAALATQREVRFKVNFMSKHDLKTLLDVKKFSQVFNNLVSNAMKHTSRGGNVSVTFSQKQKNFVLEVADTGTGIHPNDLPHIFDRFYQSNYQQHANAGGTGIGLSLCREYATMFGGSISVESTLGSGSIFRFVFPERTDMAPSALPVPMPAIVKDTTAIAEKMIAQLKQLSPVPKDATKPQILVVEDNANLRHYIKMILEPKYGVLEAENGQEAMQILQAQTGNPVELIVTDLMMPVMDGFQFVATVKKSDVLKGLPIIVLTARATLEDRLHTLRIGVDDYIVKPFVEDELLAQIQTLLKNAEERHKVEAAHLVAQAEQAETPVENNSKDAEWLEQFEKTVKENIKKDDLTAEDLARLMFVSRTVLFSEAKRLTGLTLNEYIREVRFQEVRRLLESAEVVSVKEAIGKVGIRQVKHFSQQFQERFGKKPSDFLKKIPR